MRRGKKRRRRWLWAKGIERKQGRGVRRWATSARVSSAHPATSMSTWVVSSDSLGINSDSISFTEYLQTIDHFRVWADEVRFRVRVRVRIEE